MIFFSFPDNELKKNDRSSKNLSSDRQNRNLPVQVERFLSVKRDVKSFSDIQRKHFNQLSWSLRRGCQNWILSKQMILSRENLLF